MLDCVDLFPLVLHLIGDIDVNKKAIISKIIAQLTLDIELYTKAAKTSRYEATHESSKAENKYDTRGLEASYLARGQSRQVAGVMSALEQFQRLVARDFSSNDPIDLGALVELKVGRQTSVVFVGASAGGTEILHGKTEIFVITPQSPLGQKLMGQRQGSKFYLELGNDRVEHSVIRVE